MKNTPPNLIKSLLSKVIQTRPSRHNKFLYRVLLETPNLSCLPLMITTIKTCAINDTDSAVIKQYKNFVERSMDKRLCVINFSSWPGQLGLPFQFSSLRCNVVTGNVITLSRIAREKSKYAITYLRNIPRNGARHNRIMQQIMLMNLAISRKLKKKNRKTSLGSTDATGSGLLVTNYKEKSTCFYI